jgi:ethanolamine ammonia-lyase small subunit
VTTRSPALPDPWASLRALTPARIALGRAGTSLPTAAQLDFQLAHARARDAVHHPTDLDGIVTGLQATGLRAIRVASQAPDRDTYLKRPDLGRRLLPADGERLGAIAGDGAADLALVIADGLSGLAVERHAVPLADAVAGWVRQMNWSLAPVAVVTNGRVAVGDEIGQRLGARLVAVLIGERPGLSSPDSLGVYLTWDPRPGRTDAERNCISNIRPEGLAPARAAEKLCWLMTEATRRRLTGVALKEEADGGLLR